MKTAEQRGLNSDVLYKLVIRRKFFRWCGLRQFESENTARSGVDTHPLNIAVEVAGGVQRFQITIDGEECLNEVISWSKIVQGLNWERSSRSIENKSGAGLKVFDIARKNGRRVGACLGDCRSWLGAV